MNDSLFPMYNRWEIELESGDGMIVKDRDGAPYLDFGAGIGVVGLGHCHPHVLAAVQEQLQKIWHVSNLFPIPQQEQVADQLTSHSSGDVAMFCNSGAEANEAAIKLARKHTGRQKIISFTQSFHGRSFATMAATGQEKVKKGFHPMLETFVHVPYNDAAALKEAIDDDTAAVMIESIQGEGGVHPADPSFYEQAEKQCRAHDALLIVDEIQTGMGRTGKVFAYQHYGVSPDIITVAKALGNGLPVAAMIGTSSLKDTLGPGTHGTTFGGNPLVMAAASAVLDIVCQDDFLADVTAKGEYLYNRLTEALADVPTVTDIRGKGLMIGIACDCQAQEVAKTLRQQGLIVLVAGPQVIRLLPPLIVSKEQIDTAVDMIQKVLAKV